MLPDFPARAADKALCADLLGDMPPTKLEPTPRVEPRTEPRCDAKPRCETPMPEIDCDRPLSSADERCLKRTLGCPLPEFIAKFGADEAVRRAKAELRGAKRARSRNTIPFGARSWRASSTAGMKTPTEPSGRRGGALSVPAGDVSPPKPEPGRSPPSSRWRQRPAHRVQSSSPRTLKCLRMRHGRRRGRRAGMIHPVRAVVGPFPAAGKADRGALFVVVPSRGPARTDPAREPRTFMDAGRSIPPRPRS